MNVWDLVIVLFIAISIRKAWEYIKSSRSKGCGYGSCNGDCSACAYKKTNKDN